MDAFGSLVFLRPPCGGIGWTADAEFVKPAGSLAALRHTQRKAPAPWPGAGAFALRLWAQLWGRLPWFALCLRRAFFLRRRLEAMPPPS
ncbi:hypothetical protein GCM10009612_64220 [Streptomyces beijiangensis]